MPKIYSEIEKNGTVYVDCIECERGSKGTKKDCSSGLRVKKGHTGGCFNGELFPDILKELKN